MKSLVIFAAGLVAATPSIAAELASGEQIRAAIAGNTVQGGMSDGAAYKEFYDVGGAIKADGYTGTWTVENDQMCFDYGEGANCWSVSINGDQVIWILDAKDVGKGTIVLGNPNGF